MLDDGLVKVWLVSEEWCWRMYWGCGFCRRWFEFFVNECCECE